MKRIIAVILCLMTLLSLCACTSERRGQEETKPSAQSQEEISYKPTMYVSGGTTEAYETDEKKTPEIHKAIDLFYEREYEASIAQFILALSKGEFDPIVFHKLGYMYRNGMGVEQDIEYALALYEEGAKYDQPGCLYNLGVYYYDHNDAEAALQWFTRAAEAELPLGYYGLGMMYGRPIGDMEADKEKSEEYLQKAYEAKEPEAAYSVGLFYLYSGDPEAIQKGLEILEEAFELGYAKAYMAIGDAYDAGIGVEQDGKKAYEHYLKAAEAYRYGDNYDNVGYCYEEGVGVEADYAKAVECYEKAAKSKSGMGWFDLGRMYEEGLGVEKDLGKAIECYTYKFDCPYAESKLAELLDTL